MPEERADTFLRLIRRAGRGRLKVYLGYGAGVGKTYQMLLEGHRLKDEGIDVVVGLVETHGRAETAKLIEGLEVVPRRRQEYRGVVLEEMDLDAVLARKPQVALIDELAHTNVPGSRNPKRYQDVQDILAEGIHVITTLNIQHLESLYDIGGEGDPRQDPRADSGYGARRGGPARERRPDDRGPPQAPAGGEGLPAGTDPDRAGELLQGGEPGEAPRADPPGARRADRPAPAGDPGGGGRRRPRTRSWCA